jgi:hypothetical protein
MWMDIQKLTNPLSSSHKFDSVGMDIALYMKEPGFDRTPDTPFIHFKCGISNH